MIEIANGTILLTSSASPGSRRFAYTVGSHFRPYILVQYKEPRRRGSSLSLARPPSSSQSPLPSKARQSVRRSCAEFSADVVHRPHPPGPCPRRTSHGSRVCEISEQFPARHESPNRRSGAPLLRAGRGLIALRSSGHVHRAGKKSFPPVEIIIGQTGKDLPSPSPTPGVRLAHTPGTQYISTAAEHALDRNRRKQTSCRSIHPSIHLSIGAGSGSGSVAERKDRAERTANAK